MANGVMLRGMRRRSGSVQSSHRGLRRAAAAAVEPLERRVMLSGNPSWLASNSAAAWNASTSTLTVTGSATIIADPGADEPNIVASGTAAQLTIAPTIIPADVHVGGITLSDGAIITMSSVGASRTNANHNTLVLGTLGSLDDPTFSVDSRSKLNLEDNDLIVHTGSSDTNGSADYAAVNALAVEGRDPASGAPGQPDGQWDGNGLSSSAATAADAAAGYEQVGLAVVINSTLAEPRSAWQVGSLNETLGANDIIVKYDYLGDYNLEGAVNADDAGILQIEYDNGTSNTHTWATGCSLDNGRCDANEAAVFQLQYGLGTGATVGAPSGLTATGTSTSEIDLNWTNNSTTATGIEIDRWTAGRIYTPIATGLSTGSVSYNDTGLPDDAHYWYEVRATGPGRSSANGVPSDAWTIPAGPSGLTASVPSSFEVDLSWTNNSSGSPAFTIDRSTDGINFTPIDTTAAGATSYQDLTVTDNVTYTYKVVAVNGAGANSAPSNAAMVSTPQAVLDALIATAVSDTEIDLAWTDNSGGTASVQVWQSLDDSTWTLRATLPAGTTSYPDTGLTPNTIYYYYLSASTGSAATASSNQTVAVTLPTAPTGLTATAVGPNSIILNWSGNSGGSAGFTVERSDDGITFYAITTTPLTTYTDTRVTDDTTYTYRVEAADASGDTSAPSNTASATTAIADPAEFPIATASDLHLTVCQGGGITVDSSQDDNLVKLGTSQDQDPLTAAIVRSPQHADSFTLNSDGSFSYVGQAGFVGRDWFTYQLSDGGDEQSNYATVFIDVTPLPTELSIAGVSNSTKGTIGGLLQVDDDNDAGNYDANGNPVPDNQPDATAGDRIVPDAPDLLDATLSVGTDGLQGTWTLDFPDKVKVWQQQDDGSYTEITSGTPSGEVVGAQTINLKIQGIKYSDAPRDVQINATYTPDQATSPAPTAYSLTAPHAGQDQVVLTLPKMELVTLDPSTGQVVPVDDVTSPSDPIPQVSLSIADAHIDSNGLLSVTVQGEVTDALSEIMPDASDRVQTLQFIVNGSVIDAISNLPAMSSSSGATDWQPYPFDVTFTRTLTIDPSQSRTIVIRAQTSANAAGNIGWHDVAVVLGVVPSAQFSIGQGGNVGAGGAFTVDAASGYPAIYYPVILETEDVGASPAGSFEPMMLRIEGLDQQLAEQANLSLNGVDEPIAAFDPGAAPGASIPNDSTINSGQDYYMVYKDNHGLRRILVTTFSTGASPDLSKVTPDNISFSGTGANVKFTLTSGSGPVQGASTMELPPTFTPGPAGNPQQRQWTMPEMLTWFQLLYGQAGLELLGYYQKGGNTIELKHFWRNKLWDIGNGLRARAGSPVQIELEQQTDPISAATALFEAMQYSLRYHAVWFEIDPNDNIQLYQDAYRAAYANAAGTAAIAARTYLSGVVMTNAGGVIAMSAYDAGNGDYASAGVDLIPILAPLLIKGVIKSVQVVFQGSKFVITPLLAQAITDSLQLTTLADRMALIEQRMGGAQNLSLKFRQMLVESPEFRGLWPAEGDRGKLATAMGNPPAGMVNPQAHHDLAWKYSKWFAQHGLNVNDPQYGSWVSGTPKGGDPPNWRFHQGWSNQFNADWAGFIAAEPKQPGGVYTRQQIIDQMTLLKGDYPKQGMSR